MEEETKVAVQRTYKDTVFRMLFKNKQYLLSLYNAVNGTDYTNPEELVINTLENAIYMSMRNDVSCIFDMHLSLYEHQSTVNVNMPLRNLLYVARLYEKLIPKDKLYAKKQILLPTPKFIVFYNGEEPQPERREFRLSDAYMTEDGETNLELVVIQLNINAGYNADIKECCQILKEYGQYVEKVRTYAKVKELREAVEQAITECIQEGILKEFLIENRKEVVGMSIFEYDEATHIRVEREEAYEDGMSEGMRRGISQGISQGLAQGTEKTKHKIIANMLRKHHSPEDVSECTETPLEYVYQVESEMLQCLQEEKEYNVEE